MICVFYLRYAVREFEEGWFIASTECEKLHNGWNRNVRHTFHHSNETKIRVSIKKSVHVLVGQWIYLNSVECLSIVQKLVDRVDTKKMIPKGSIIQIQSHCTVCKVNNWVVWFHTWLVEGPHEIAPKVVLERFRCVCVCVCVWAKIK
jgi:hypothetical protein